MYVSLRREDYSVLLLLTIWWGKRSVPYAGCGSQVFRTSDSQSRNPGYLAVVSKVGQIRIYVNE